MWKHRQSAETSRSSRAELLHPNTKICSSPEFTHGSEGVLAMSGVGMIMLRGSRQICSHSRVIRSALLQQERLATQYARKDSTDYSSIKNLNECNERKETARPVIYVGAMSDTVQRVKMLSLSTCCLSVVGGPFVTFFTNPELSVIMKGALCSTMVLLSASTTFALHWFASPYIHKLTWVPGSKEVDVEVLSWMATKLKRKIKLSDIGVPYTRRPLVTFSASNEYYFVEKDKFPNKELLDQLLPEKRKQ